MSLLFFFKTLQRSVLLLGTVFALAPVCPAVMIYGYYYRSLPNDPNLNWQVSDGATYVTFINPGVPGPVRSWTLNFPIANSVECYSPNVGCKGYEGVRADFCLGKVILKEGGNTLIIENVVMAADPPHNNRLYADITYNGVTTQRVFLASAQHTNDGVLAPAVVADLGSFYFGSLIESSYFIGFS